MLSKRKERKAFTKAIRHLCAHARISSKENYLRWLDNAIAVLIPIFVSSEVQAYWRDLLNELIADALNEIDHKIYVHRLVLRKLLNALGDDDLPSAKLRAALLRSLGKRISARLRVTVLDFLNQWIIFLFAAITIACWFYFSAIDPKPEAVLFPWFWLLLVEWSLYIGIQFYRNPDVYHP